MSKEYVIVPKEDYVDTCDAIREKINSTALLKSDEMAQAVRDIPTPKEEQKKVVTITENGTTEILPDEGKALSKVSVNTNVADSYYDIFWDDYQQMGTRTNYENAFARGYYTANIFPPKYDMFPTNVQNMFTSFPSECDLREILRGRTIDFKNAGGSYCFSQSKFTALPTIDRSSSYSIYNWFDGCTSLHTIEKLILNRNAGAEQLRGFSGCSNLKNIIIDGEIGSTFGMNRSPLTAESAKSIITHLVNYKGTENEFVYSVVFADSVWELLNAEGATAPDNITWEEYVNSIGWNK